jgi:hypothetical protein
VCPTTNDVSAQFATKTATGESLSGPSIRPKDGKPQIEAGGPTICEGRQIFEECLLI